MRRFLLTVIAAITLSMFESCIENYSNSDIQDINFNDSWLFIKSDASTSSVIENSLLSGATVAGMEMVRLPHTPDIAPLKAASKWRGICFYQKKFTIPAKLKGKMMSLRFEGAMNVADVWVNGKKIITHEGGYLPFVAPFSPQQGENVVLVKLDNNYDEASDNPLPVNTYGGIYRNVWLCAKDSLSFTDASEDLPHSGGIFVSTSNLQENRGTVRITANIRNAYSSERKVCLVYKILDHNRKLIGRGSVTRNLPSNAVEDFSDSLTLKDITYWNLDNPWLYTLEAKIVDNDNILDLESVDFGFRTVSLNPDYFAINGNKIKPLGVTRHQEYPYVGYAVSDQAQWRDAYKIKKAGFNFVRTCHCQPSEAFLKACDSYGIMVIDPVTDTAECKEVIRRDRNHPCILSWDMVSVGGEADNASLDYVKKTAKAEYPTDYCYVTSSGQLKHFDSQLQVQIQASEKMQLQQNLNMIAEQNNILASNAMTKPCLPMFDYTNGASGGLEYSGLMSINRRPKMSYYFFQSQSEIDNSELKAFSDPVCYIASSWIPTESKGVTVFSNCSSVELFVDGVSAGKQKPVSSNSNRLSHNYFYFDVSCENPGTLRAIAYSDDDEPLTECTVRTPLSPTRIKIVIDESGTLIAANDVVLVHCYILDKNNTIVPTADSEVEFSVSGTAQLLSPAKIKAEAGVATALIRTGNSNNDFTISAKCGQMYTVADK